MEIIRTPYRAPNANAFAERWVRTVREECLDHLLIVSERHLKSVLTEYIRYYNLCRAHQGIGQRIPEAPEEIVDKPLSENGGGMTARSAISRRDVLGGIIHDYYKDDCRTA